jgi:hypothetical protein
VGARHPNPKRFKIHRTYSIDDAATLCGVHRNTVRAWIRRGLPSLDDQRPTLILGADLAAFARLQRSQNKRPCQPGEIYCMRCREPRQSAGLQAVYSPLTASSGNLTGLCPVCACRMFRRVSLQKLALAGGLLHIAMPQAPEHIDERPQPSVNSDFGQQGANHENASPSQ